MRRHPRRDMTLAGVCITAISLAVAPLRAQPAELVVRNAIVLSVDAKGSRASALAIAGGKLLAVGSDGDVQAHVAAGTRVVDLKGKTVTPGFIDAHCHPSPVYPEDRLWASVDLFRVKTMDDRVDALKKKAAKTPKGLTVNGVRYRDTLLGRHLTRRDLDRVSTEHPVVISHSSGHLRACNSLALKLAGGRQGHDRPSRRRVRAGRPRGVYRGPQRIGHVPGYGRTPAGAPAPASRGYRRLPPPLPGVLPKRDHRHPRGRDVPADGGATLGRKLPRRAHVPVCHVAGGRDWRGGPSP